MPTTFLDVIIPLAGIALGGLIVLVPLVGITARLAAKPLVDAWKQARPVAGADTRVEMLEQRVALLEQQIEHVERQNERLLEDADFRLRLKDGGV